MTAAGTYLARSIGLLILPAFIVAYFAIIPSAPAQQQPELEVIAEYNGTVAAAREAEVAPRLEGLLSKIDFSAGHAAAISRCAWLSRNSISDATFRARKVCLFFSFTSASCNSASACLRVA